MRNVDARIKDEGSSSRADSGGAGNVYEERKHDETHRILHSRGGAQQHFPRRIGRMFQADQPVGQLLAGQLDAMNTATG